MAYNDMYNDYHCCTIPYDYPYSFEERNKIYLQCKQIPYWIWNEFDTTSISFDIKKLLKHCCCYPEIEFDDIDPEKNKFHFTFYNFRYEMLFEVDKEITETVSVEISKDISEKYFPSGIYFCSLVLQSIEEEPEEENEDETTDDSEEVVDTEEVADTEEQSEEEESEEEVSFSGVRTILNKEDCLLNVK